MTAFEAAGVYIAVNILILLYLAVRVVSGRRKTKTSLGDGGHDELSLAIRVHGNAAEYIPVVLIGLLSAAYLGAPALWVHILGAMFTFGRLLHAFGMGGGVGIGRQAGILLSWIAMLGISAALLWLVFS